MVESCNSNVSFRKKQIWSGLAAGIAITEDGRGHISYTEISNMEWAGIDVRYGCNPAISHNQIVKGHLDAIAVRSGGKSVMFDNDLIGRGRFLSICSILLLSILPCSHFNICPF